MPLELVHSNDAPHPVAEVRGQLLTELPADLYIPPDALEVFFDTFEGPLDLLLKETNEERQLFCFHWSIKILLMIEYIMFSWMK